VLHDLRYHFEEEYAIYDEECEEPFYPLTVKGLYLDAALTQPVPSGLTLDELAAIGTLYVDYEIKAGYAIVKVSHDFREEHSAAAKIVCVPTLFGMSSDMEEYNPARQAGETIVLDRTPGERGEAVTVYVNGELTEADSLTLAGGEIYSILYVKTERDEHLGLAFLFLGFDMF
jgi:hypothetical protein